MIETLADIIDVVAVLVLVWALIMASVAALGSYFRAEANSLGELKSAPLVIFRITLGRWMLTALEILIVSDILHSISHRTLEEVGILAVVVIIRVAIAYFLDLEIARIEKTEDRKARVEAAATGAVGQTN